MRRSVLAAAIGAALVALAAGPAAAFVRTADPRSGKALFWPLPMVSWRLDRDWPTSAPSCQVQPDGSDPTLDAVRASFAQWEQSCADLRLLYAGPLSETRVGGDGTHDNLVVFRRGWCSQNPAAMSDPAGCMDDPDLDCGNVYGCFEDSKNCANQANCSDWGIVALTSVLYDPTTGRILDADMELNGWDGLSADAPVSPPKHGWYFTCFPGPTQPAACGTYDQPGCSYIDLQNTVTHEAGHFVGLRHPCTTDTLIDPDLPLCSSGLPVDQVAYIDRTMSPTTAPRETKKRDLSSDDVAGVCAIYPHPSGCACGSGGAGGLVALLVGALALRPLRPRRAR